MININGTYTPMYAHEAKEARHHKCRGSSGVSSHLLFQCRGVYQRIGGCISRAKVRLAPG